MENSILEPLKDYNSIYKELFKKNATKFYDDLVKKSKINIEENRATCKKYYDICSKIDKINKLISKYRGLKAFLIVITSFSLLTSIFLIYLSIKFFVAFGATYLDSWILLCVALVLIGGSIASIIVIVNVLNKLIKDNNKVRDDFCKVRDNLLALCYNQMAPLNNLFDYNMTSEIITKTCPLIKLDKSFDVKKYDYMNTKYGLTENTNQNSSTYFLLSGSLVGNPFILERTYNTRMGTKIYTGYLTITYTDRDSNGKTVIRTQTLTATVTKPFPEYYYDTNLIYGNEAAPKLVFSRNCNKKVSSMNEKKLEKHIKKGEKAIKKKEQHDLMDNDASTNFQSIGNEKFEVLFNALDRNNEVEFRLLFTPLAQKNFISLITTAIPYGDDFDFYKRNCLNYIHSLHSQYQDYYSEPSNYISFDYDLSRSEFINYNCQYFKSLFFDLAPLLSIPLYQQHKPQEFIYKKIYDRNFTNYEAEQLANSFNPKKFKHKDSSTNAILKTTLVNKDGESDKVKVRAYTYKGIDRVTYVSVYGRDGHYHDVPVKWIEYIPIYKDTIIEITHNEQTGVAFNNSLKTNDKLKSFLNTFSSVDDIIYQRNLLAFILKDVSYNEESSTSLKNILNENELMKGRK